MNVLLIRLERRLCPGILVFQRFVLFGAAVVHLWCQASPETHQIKMTEEGRMFVETREHRQPSSAPEPQRIHDPVLLVALCPLVLI